MGIILSETPHPRQTSQFSRLLPAVDRSELSQTHRKIPVGAMLARKNLYVMRAIHWLEQKALNFTRGDKIQQFRARNAIISELLHGIALDDGRKLAVLVIWEVARRTIEFELPDVGGEDLKVTLFVQFGGDEVLQLTSDNPSFWFPQWQPLPHRFIKGEEAHLAAQTTMIALFGFLKPVEMLIEKSPVFEAGSVDPLKRLVVFVAFVKSARHRHDLKGFAIAGASHVRAGTEIPEIPVFEDGDLLVPRNVIEKIDLEDRLDLTVGNGG